MMRWPKDMRPQASTENQKVPVAYRYWATPNCCTSYLLSPCSTSAYSTCAHPTPSADMQISILSVQGVPLQASA